MQAGRITGRGMSEQETRAVIYVRQSLTRDEDDSLSLESQQRVCREYVERHGWRLVGTFVEPDTKGWRTDRPQFDAMLQAVRDGRADTVVVFKLSRFARNLIHQETVLNEIADAGGELVSVTEPFLNTSPMVRQILGAVNEQHRRDMADHLKAAFAERGRRGLHHGYAPIGYTKDDDGALHIDEAGAETVRRIFREAMNGTGARTIALDLNDDGITTQRGRPWTHATVLGVLRNPVYAGHVQMHGEIVRRDMHDAIVTDDEQQRALAAIDRRRGIRRKTGATSWADGFVYHSCGRRMYLTAWQRSRSGTIRWRYRCNAQFDRKRRGDHACHEPGGSIFTAEVEATFLLLLVEALSDVATPEDAMRWIEAQRDATQDERDKARRRLEARLADVQRQRERLLDLVLAGRVDDDLYSTRDAALKAEAATIRAELDTVPADVPVEALTARRAAIMDVADALPIVAHSAPQRLPGLLHTLDVRLVMGGDGARLEWGESSAPFVRGISG